MSFCNIHCWSIYNFMMIHFFNYYFKLFALDGPCKQTKHQSTFSILLTGSLSNPVQHTRGKVEGRIANTVWVLRTPNLALAVCRLNPYVAVREQWNTAAEADEAPSSNNPLIQTDILPSHRTYLAKEFHNTDKSRSHVGYKPFGTCLPCRSCLSCWPSCLLRRPATSLA